MGSVEGSVEGGNNNDISRHMSPHSDSSDDDDGAVEFSMAGRRSFNFNRKISANKRFDKSVSSEACLLHGSRCVVLTLQHNIVWH